MFVGALLTASRVVNGTARIVFCSMTGYWVFIALESSTIQIGGHRDYSRRIMARNAQSRLTAEVRSGEGRPRVEVKSGEDEQLAP